MEVILVNHGSRRAQFNALMEGWAAELSKRLGVKVTPGYNEYAEPNWRDLVKSAEGPVVVALAFLGEGNHVARDVLGDLGVDGYEKWQMSKFGKLVYVTRPLGDSPLVFAALYARVRRALEVSEPQAAWDPEEIEESSMRYVADVLGLDLSRCDHRLTARAVYATGNLDLAKFVYITPDLCKAAEEALGSGLWAVADVKMVATGIRYPRVRVAVEETWDCGSTKAACGTAKILRELRVAALVVGNAPTALKAGLDLWRGGEVEIAFLVAAPVGFTNAAAVKEEAASSGLPAFILRGTYGGSGVAAAVFNELTKLGHG
ncbi:MAG: precorrin-8X methylmutase [Thermoproteus sp.]